MALPFFFIDDLKPINETIVLDEDTSKHITQVLRMKVDERLLLTDGKGVKAEAVIVNDHRKRCEVKIESLEREKEKVHQVTIALSLTKNSSRFEWFLEKATEIGVSEIIPLICERTEKEKFRFDRMKNILVSAMLQSQQCWLPVLHPPTSFAIVLQTTSENKFIAHCLEEEKKSLTDLPAETKNNSLILIGPEGDFTPNEIEAALAQNFIPVTLGQTRLRTETAGMVAATLLCVV